ncbi:MAG TPA: hypothetical protein VKF62_14555 [Planctomycetota bacterium]|nr:hypothetical protein [Planctomycetota bacterium]
MNRGAVFLLGWLGALAALAGLVAIEGSSSRNEPEGGISIPCTGAKPEGHAWIDAHEPLAVTLNVELDLDGDGKGDLYWRAEGGGKLGLYWRAVPGVLYRASWTVAGEAYPPSEWKGCP